MLASRPRDWLPAIREEGGGGVLIALSVEPASSRPGMGPYDPWRQRIRARVRSQADRGRANRELTELLAGVLGVPVSHVSIVRGATSHRKTARIEGVSWEAALAALDGAIGDQEASDP